MPFSRPTDYLDWGGTKVEPTSGEKSAGFVPDFRPPAEWHNWMFGNVDDWVKYLDQQVQTVLIPNSDFQWMVGPGGTHASINALIADAAVLPGDKILVKGNTTLIATQVISKDDLEFVFHPSAVYSKSLSVTPGLSITSNRVTISGGRWNAFNGGSDVAIQLESGSKNCSLSRIRFVNCTTGINDIGNNNDQFGIIEEI